MTTEQIFLCYELAVIGIFGAVVIAILRGLK